MDTHLTSFSIVGIAITTTNESGQSGTDIPALWQKFMTENIASKIPGKIGAEIYCLYTNYEKDYTRPYTAILGCAVSDCEQLPAGMICKTIEAGIYKEYNVKGKLLDNPVFNAWVNIWSSDIQRAYTTDIEIYRPGEGKENIDMSIYIAIK